MTSSSFDDPEINKVADILRENASQLERLVAVSDDRQPTMSVDKFNDIMAVIQNCASTCRRAAGIIEGLQRICRKLVETPGLAEAVRQNEIAQRPKLHLVRPGDEK